MRVHLGKAECECVCVLSREGWIIFISLQLIRPCFPSLVTLSRYLKTLSPCFSSFILCVFLSLTHPFSFKHSVRHTYVPLDLISDTVYLAGIKKTREERQISLKSSKCHREEHWAVCCFLSPLILLLISLPPSTCISPTLYLQLPASLRPCRMTWHECRRHRWDKAARCEGCEDWWMSHAHILLATSGWLNMMMLP